MPKLSKLTQLNILHVLNDGFLVSLPLLLPFLQKDLALSLTWVGFLGTVLKSFEIFLALPASYFAEKIGSLRLLVLAIFIYGIGYLFAGFSTNLLFITIAFLLAGRSWSTRGFYLSCLVIFILILILVGIFH